MLLLIAILLICFGLFYMYLYPSARKGEPPLETWWIPYLGVAHNVLFEKHEYLNRLRKKHGDLYTIYMMGNYYHVCYSKTSLKLYLSNPISDISEFIKPLLESLAPKNNVISDKFSAGASVATKVLQNMENQKWFLKSQKRVYDVVIKQWIKKKQIDLFAEIAPFVCKMNLEQFVGYSEDSFVQNMMQTDAAYIISKKPLQSYLLKKLGITRVEDDCFDQVIATIKQLADKRLKGEHNDPNQHIPFDDFLAESETNFDEKKFATFVWGIVFAAQLNTTFLLSWAIIRLFNSKEDELVEIKQELTKIYAGRDDPIDLEVLRDNTHKTEQFLYEIFRLYYEAIPAGRKLLGDVKVDGYLLKGGTNLISPVLSRGAWISKDGSICPAINLANQEKENLACKFATGLEWIPFGGGLHPCSGRNFALIEVKCILSLMWNTVKLNPVLPVDKYEMATVLDWIKPKDGQVVWEISMK